MDFDRSLRKRIAWLNNEGGFENKILYTKVAEIAFGNDQVFAILKTLEEKKDVVKDPTAYVTTALRKSSPMQAPAMMPHGYAVGPNAFAPDISADRKLSKRIREMNTVGGFDNQINYSKVMEAAQGLSSAKVNQILGSVEEKRDQVKDPTAFVAAACRRVGGGHAPMAHGAAEGMWVQIPQSMPMLMQQNVFDAEADRKLRKHIAWLNNEGGFANSIKYQNVLEVAQHLNIHTTMKAFKQLEEKKEEVKDPTAWVTSRLRKSRRDDSSSAPQVDDTADPDRQVRRRIAWMNNEGGFGNTINYTKVSEAVTESGGVALGDIITVLDGLQEKRSTVKDPTAFVTAGIRRASKPGGVIRTIAKKASSGKGK